MIYNGLITSFSQTLLMTLLAAALAYIVGLPLGILLYVTGNKGLMKNKVINSIFGTIVNILRSIPCLLLIVLLIPLTREVFGRGTGEWYTIIIPLFFASFPFVSNAILDKNGLLIGENKLPTFVDFFREV